MTSREKAMPATGPSISRLPAPAPLPLGKRRIGVAASPPTGGPHHHDAALPPTVADAALVQGAAGTFLVPRSFG